MGIFSKLTSKLETNTKFFLLDTDSDKLITQNCKFNPYHLKSDYKKKISLMLKFLIHNNFEREFSIPEVAVWKLTAYAGIFESSGNVNELSYVIAGINRIYENYGNTFRKEIKNSELTKYLFKENLPNNNKQEYRDLISDFASKLLEVCDILEPHDLQKFNSIYSICIASIGLMCSIDKSGFKNEMPIFTDAAKDLTEDIRLPLKDFKTCIGEIELFISHLPKEINADKNSIIDGKSIFPILFNMKGPNIVEHIVHSENNDSNPLDDATFEVMNIIFSNYGEDDEDPFYYKYVWEPEEWMDVVEQYDEKVTILIADLFLKIDDIHQKIII
jgi:hypothetical protein